MSEIIDLNLRDVSEWFAIMAITLKENYKSLLSPREAGGLEVALTINGVEVPFAKTVKTMYDRMNETIDNRAAQKAYDILNLEGLLKIQEYVEEVDSQIREKIENLFGVKLRESDY